MVIYKKWGTSMASKWKAGDLLNYQNESGKAAIYLIVAIHDGEDTAAILIHSNQDRTQKEYWLGRVQYDRWHEVANNVTLIGNIFERNV
jgi:hypothetical protein